MVQKFLGLNISNNINDRNKIPVLFYNESRVLALAKYFFDFLYFVAIRNIFCDEYFFRLLRNKENHSKPEKS